MFFLLYLVYYLFAINQVYSSLSLSLYGSAAQVIDFLSAYTALIFNFFNSCYIVLIESTNVYT